MLSREVTFRGLRGLSHTEGSFLSVSKFTQMFKVTKASPGLFNLS